ncbi:hypothetical protein V7075_10265 [Neobacillus drentensis]|uniref:hypothetical protein n=1 Tax=Neobacillus drentensis TaxID=220684 RepID=UPI002FFD8096
MIEGKGLVGKKIHRVNVSLTNKQAFKLNRLATACNMKPTTLAAVHRINLPQFITFPAMVSDWFLDTKYIKKKIFYPKRSPDLVF